MVENKLMGSLADKAHYCFVNSAERTFDEQRSPLNEGSILGKIVEKGAHFSFNVAGVEKPVNLFLDVEDSFKLYLGLRDAMRHVIETMSEQDKLHLKVLTERDAWGLRCFGGGRKSNIADDLGLQL